ncbi:hypothetical protein EZS27_004963 [termite gut metagenome]|uniref:DNA replication and repair protein RecF n=1 Tax=termite gut metagenome TaxID=433724 RepID=A0A5J4SN97_9ZZZZ
MIKAIDISNFKLHDKTRIETGNLTILTGLNGMGKSTVIQSLLLLRQSFLSSDLDKGLNLNGDLCKVGTSGELSCWSSQSHTLDLTLEFDNNQILKFAFDYPDSIYETFLPNSSQEKGYSKNVVERHSIFNNHFQYLSAYRFGPMEIYKRDSLIVQTQRQLSKEQGKGEYVVHFLNYYRNEALPIPELLYPLLEDPSLETQTETWLRKISPNIKIKIEPSGADFKLGYKYERVNNRQTEAAAAINTGFGITYILPVFVAILSAHPGALIIIENPEAHIHPGGQAVLMQLISLAAKNGVQIILETHSDHIINGALIAVKRADLTKEQLSVYFFERNEEEHSAIVHKLEVTDTGKIRRPPKDFFDQFDKDLQQLTGF